MTAATMAQYLGRAGIYQTDGMAVSVRIMDARVRFGSVDLQIEPIAGSGRKWTPAEKVATEQESRATR